MVLCRTFCVFKKLCRLGCGFVLLIVLGPGYAPLVMRQDPGFKAFERKGMDLDLSTCQKQCKRLLRIMASAARTVMHLIHSASKLSGSDSKQQGPLFDSKPDPSKDVESLLGFETVICDRGPHDGTK